MGKGKVIIGLTQHACGPDKEANIEKAVEQIKEAAKKGAKIVLTQELFAGEYFCQTCEEKLTRLAEPIPGPVTNRMQEVAKELGIVILCSVYEYAMDGIYYNSAVVFDADGTNLGTYRKHHIPESPKYYEKFYFSPGDSGYKVFNTKYGNIGIVICWDEWFPEPSRILALKGSDIIFYPSAIGTEQNTDVDTHLAWRDAIRGHGIHNHLFVAANNRVGTEQSIDGNGSMTFHGGSFISGPLGQVVEEASRVEEEVIVAEIDLDEIRTVRDMNPLLRDRRIDSYGEILTRELVVK